MVLARSAGQAVLWLPWLINEAAADGVDDSAATANSNANNTSRRRQKQSHGRRGIIAASSLTGLLGLLFGWLVGGGSGHVYSF